MLNISLGVQPSSSTVLNPLDQAVEAVWNSGITVVASAGNAGPFNGTILSPGDDPLVITVGALDDMATPSVSDDEMNDFSSVGPTSPDGWVKPDLVTSGRSVVSLAAPGSTIYDDNPSARIGAANFVGSGTSFSAAITSGAAALVLADNPGLHPRPGQGPPARHHQPGAGRQPLRRRPRRPQRLRRGHVGPDEPQPVDVRPAPCGSRRDGLAVAHWPRRHLEPEPLVRALHRQTPSTGWSWNGTAWNGGNWNGWAWNDNAWNGWAWNDAAWNGSDWSGWAWNERGLGRHGLERHGLGRRRLEQLGMELTRRPGA